MTAMTLSRLRRMTRTELSWRARTAARTAAQRVAVRMRPPGWHRSDLHDAVAEGVLDASLRARAHPPWTAVHAALAERLRARTSRFALDPASSDAVRRHVLARWPGAASLAGGRADGLLAARYDVLGYRGLDWAPAGSGVDWHLDPVHHRRAPTLFWADVPYLDPAIGDHKVIWEVNRHQHWLQFGRALWLTGDPRYRRALLEQLQGWLAANPPLVGINWASMLEISLRAISWTWGLHFLLADVGIGDQGSGIGDRGSGIGDRGSGIGDRGSGIGEAPSSSDPRSPIPDPRPWLVDMFVALDRQLTHVERNLSVYFSPNTHLTGEALALYVVGVALPELAASRRWADTGRRVLLAEIDRQIRGDGGHVERSTHYQRYTLDFYLMALLTAEREGDQETTSRFTDAVRRLAEFTRTMADDRGYLPLIGDDDGGMLWPIAGRACRDVRDSLALAAVVLDRPDLAPWGMQEEVVWIAGRRAMERGPLLDRAHAAVPPMPSRTLADSGYVVARDAAGSHAVFDAGPHGHLNGGHAHAGALALTLTLAGRPLLVDPGTSTYTADRRLRDRLRSSMSHNTVTLGNRSQAVPSGPFHWQTRAHARLDGSRHNPRFDWAEGSHDGYAPVRHRRTLLRTVHDGWLIVDDIVGSGRINAGAHWHFDPGWTLTCDAPGRLRATDADGVEAWLLHDAGEEWLGHGDEQSGLGWYAPVYGTLIPTWTARATRLAEAPFTIVTWLGAGSSGAPALERLDPVCGDGGTAVGVRVLDGPRASVFLLRPGEPPHREGRGCAMPGYQTDARMLHYAEDSGALVALDLIDASHALTRCEGWFSIAAAAPVIDLHAAVANGALHLQASEPPPELRLAGAAVCGLQSIHLNDREILPPPPDLCGALIVTGGDWGDAATSTDRRTGRARD